MALIHSLSAEYRTDRSCLIFNDSSLADIKALTIGNSDDRPLWQPSMREGEPSRIEGFKYVINSKCESYFQAYKTLIFADLSQYTLRVVRNLFVIKLNERYMDEFSYNFGIVLRLDGEWMTSAKHARHFCQSAVT